MLSIIIFLFVICFFIGILKAIWDAFKDIILGILGIVIIIAAIAFLGPLVLAALPLILMVLVALFILGCIISFWTKLKYGSQLRGLDRIGIAKISGSSDDWKQPKDLGFVVITSSGYVISNRFRKCVTEKTDQRKIVTVDTFRECCLQVAPSFQPDNTAPLLRYMESQNFLVPLQEYRQEKRYLSHGIVYNCARLLETEGAATKAEFSAICKASPVCSNIPVNPEIIASTILNYMVTQGDAHKVELSDLNENLFVSNKAKSNSKMVRREISMD